MLGGKAAEALKAAMPMAIAPSAVKPGGTRRVDAARSRAAGEKRGGVEVAAPEGAKADADAIVKTDFCPVVGNVVESLKF